ncbi:MAG: T9SS type A sorting domain-containing protein [Cytophagales bacterium]|nr:T9SS type A sorting domain-containing protein [Cytophaga sp.]
MKKLYTTLFALALTTASFAQQLANNGLEEWSTAPGNPNAVDPTSFYTTNACAIPSITGGLPCLNNVEKTTDKHSGTYAAKLTVATLFAYNINGALTNDANFQSANDAVPVAFTGKPINLSAYVKFTPVSGDNAIIQVSLFSKGDSIGGGTINLTSTLAAYTKVEAVISYVKTFTGTPDGILFDALCGDIDNPQLGTTLFIDDITLGYNVTATYATTSPVALFTDVQAGNLHFSEKVEQVSFIDMNGRTAQSSTGSAEDFSTAGMNPGMYIVRYNYNSNTYVGKVVIQ